MFFSEAGLRISYLNKSSRSTFSYLSGSSVYNSSVVAGNKYVLLYVLLAGIFGGILIIFSFFLFCKYCRGKSQDQAGVVALTIGDSWAFGDTSISIDRPDDINSLRDPKNGEYRRESVIRNRTALLDIHNGQSHIGNLEQHEELENTFTSAVATTSKLIDDHVQTSIYFQKQKSNRSKESSPITSFTNTDPETLDCEVAVEVHPGPNQSEHLDRTGNIVCHTHNTAGRHYNSKIGWSKDENNERSRGTPYRTQSIEWTKLESSLDFWRKEHSRHQQDDTSELSKVRYNDTGSLEEVNVENLVDYYVEDELMVHLEEDHERVKKQYRRLWQLRATLEEDEDKKRSNTKVADIHQSHPSNSPTHSPSHSPEREASHTTSFESNTEPLLDEVGKWMPHSLQLPSYEARRQTYKNILSWRLQKMEARNQRHHHGRQTSLDDNSFDSMDTVDTEGSSDASRIDQATTSFESTTDNTDSTSEGHMHRLQQLRADSGYRSLENPAPSLKMMYHVSSTEYEPYEHRIPCLGESIEESAEIEKLTNPNEIYAERYSSRKHVTLDVEIKENVSELTSSLSDTSSEWKGWKKHTNDSASKKRRDFSCRPNPAEEVFRDYSVDEKSDALFREFSKYDSDSSCGKHRFKTYRRLHGYYQDPLFSEPSSGFSFNYTDDETELASVPIIRIATDDDSSDQL